MGAVLTGGHLFSSFPVVFYPDALAIPKRKWLTKKHLVPFTNNLILIETVPS